MLAVFSNSIISAPQELIQAGNGTPSPKKTASDLVDSFLQQAPSSVCLTSGPLMHMCYTHENQALLQPRAFAVKEDIFCLFEGTLENLPRLKQQYGLGKNANEVLLVLEAYKALRDRAPYPASHMVAHLVGRFAFIVFDRATSSAFIASDQEGKVPFFWGITADGFLAFSDGVGALKGACGRSLASFPAGCFFSSSTGLRSYEHPKNKVTAEPATDDGILGATFKVERPHIRAFKDYK